MPAVDHKKAQMFMKGISSDDTVAVVHDTDADGVTAGIIYYAYALKRAKKVFHIPFVRSYRDVPMEKIKLANKVIVTDVGPSLAVNLLKKITKKRVLYVDHHQKDVSIPGEILEYRTLSQGYIPSARTAFELTNEKKWLAVVGTIADAGYQYKENKKFINSFLKDEKTTFERFRNDVVFHINNALTYFNSDPKKAFRTIYEVLNYQDIKIRLKMYSAPVEKEINSYLKRFDKEMQMYNNLILFYYLEPSFEIKRAIAFKLSQKYSQNIIVFASPTDKNKISISARNQSKKYDMTRLLKFAVTGLADSRSGGHKAAAGATIRKEDLEAFKSRLQSFKP